MYWIVLDHIKTSANIQGAANINDLRNAECRGDDVSHLDKLQTLWDKKLFMFEAGKRPNEETLQPMYDQQIKKNKAFRNWYDQYYTLFLVVFSSA